MLFLTIFKLFIYHRLTSRHSIMVSDTKSAVENPREFSPYVSQENSCGLEFSVMNYLHLGLFKKTVAISGEGCSW